MYICICSVHTHTRSESKELHCQLEVITNELWDLGHRNQTLGFSLLMSRSHVLSNCDALYCNSAHTFRCTSLKQLLSV